MSSNLELGRVMCFTAVITVCGGLLIPAIAQGAANYRDPRGRYTLHIPDGWSTAQPNQDAVQFACGSAYVTMLVLPASDPGLMMNSIATQTGKQWRNFTEARRGAANLGGRSGQYATYSGTNPMGADSFLQLLGVTDGSVTYLLMTSAPKADFTRQKSAFDQIERSFTLTSAGKSLDIPAPAPAGADVSSKTSRFAPAPAQPAAQQVPARQSGGSSSSANPSAAGGGNNVYRMKLARIVDARGFERPITALTLLIPSDWQFQGGVEYGQGTGCHANLAKLKFRATSPDGRLAVELFPDNTWQWADDRGMVNIMQASNQQMARFGVRGCDIMPPETANDYVRRNVLPIFRRDARVVGAEPMPDAAQRLQAEARQLQQAVASQGIRVSVRTDVGRVRVSYALGGQPMEEWFTAMTSSGGVVGPSFNMYTGQAGQTMYYTNAADHIYGLRAPQGQLDAQEKFFQLVLGSVQVNPEWQGRVSQAIASLQAQDTNGAAARSAIITKSGQDISKIIHDTYQNTTSSRERSMESWSRYMRGVQTFRNPNTGETVELSNQYGHAWAGPDNQYILSDSANFNPNVSQQGHWTPLELFSR